MILGAKLLLAIVGCCLTFALLNWCSRPTLTSRAHDIVMICIVIFSRLAIFFILFLCFRVPPQSDVTVYYREAVAALGGGVPLVSIPTAYGPLFDEIAALVVFVWDSPVALVFVVVLLEIASFPLWLRVGRAAFTEIETRRAAALYALNPLAISTVVIAGQNHVGISFFLAIAFLGLLRDRDGLSGACVGLSIIAIKFLSLLFAPVLFLAARRRVAWATSFLVFPVAGYGFVALAGAHPSNQIAFHAYYSSSGNLPFLLSAVGLTFAQPQQRLIADVVAFAILCAAFLAALWRFGFPPNASRAVLMCGFVLLVTLIVSKKAFGSYLIVALFPICLIVARQERFPAAVIGFLLILALATLEPSLWFRWMRENQLDVLMKQSLPSDMVWSKVMLFFFCDLVLVGGYVWLSTMAWRAMGSRSVEQSRERRA